MLLKDHEAGEQSVPGKDDSPATETVEHPANSLAEAENLLGAPPAYQDPPAESPSSGSNITDGLGKPINFVFIERTHQAVRGAYVIDPTMQIPNMLLPPLPEGETTRHNLRISSVHGSINVDVHIVLPQTVQKVPERVNIDISSTHASVTVRLHNLSSIPVTLSAKSSHASVNVYLPRSFRGIVTQSTRYARSAASPAIESVMTSLSEVEGKRTTFVGAIDGDGWDATRQEWLGDVVSLESIHASVKMSFIDEQVDLNKSFFGPGGFLPSTSLFSFFGGRK